MDSEKYVPLSLSGSGDMTQNWQEWKDSFIMYLTVNNYMKTSEDLKIRKLKEFIGPLGIYFVDIIKKDYDENELNNLQRLLAKLDIAFKVPLTEVESRYNFFTCSRLKDESLNKYIERLKEKAINCNFGTIMNSLIRDKVIADINDNDLLLKLFKIKFLTLSNLFTICYDYEVALQKNREKSKQVEKSKKVEQVEKAKKVEQVEKAKKFEQVGKAIKAERVEKAKKTEKISGDTEKTKIDNRTDDSDINKTVSQNDQTQPVKFNRNCWRCNQKHQIRRCPAFGHKCEKCGDRNHFTHCCNMKILNTEEKKPPFGIPNNMRVVYDFSHNTPSNMNPSAPPDFSADNTLYPNLNYMQGSERLMHSANSKLHQTNIKTNEMFKEEKGFFKFRK